MPHPQLCHHIPCHHMCHATSSTMPCHPITTLVFSLSLSCHHIHWLFLCHSWTPLTSMTTITQIFQQSPPLSLMATSKHSPPLTTMTKDNLLCYWGFHVFLISDNSPYHHISTLLTQLGTNQCIIIYLNICFLAIGSWMITWIIDLWSPPVTVLPLLC